MNNPPTSYNIGSINISAMSNANKVHSLCTFIRSMDFEIILLQEVENAHLSIPGFNVITNVDCSKRGTAIALKSHIPFSNIQRSLDTRILSVTVGNSITVCNVYANSGSQNASSREFLFRHTLPYYLQSSRSHLVLGGDFNCVVNTKDATGSSNYSQALKHLIDNLQLCDSWDHLHRNQIAFSFVRPNCASRIDRIYVSTSLVPHLRTSEYFVTPFSDHKAHKVRCCLPDLGKPHGRGFWSIRPHVLTTENLEEYEVKWNRWLRERRNYDSWLSWWTDCAKPRTLSFFKWKTNLAFRRFHATNELLYGKLREAYDNLYTNPQGIIEVNKIKAQMLRLQSNFSKAFERINDQYIAGEKISTFQLGDRLQRRNKSTIHTIRHGNNQLTNAADIERHVCQYFQELFSAENLPENTRFPSNRIIPQNSESNMHAMDEITTQELFFAIKSSASRKSPGCDGLPKEFYIKTFDIIHRQLNLIINEALRGNIRKKFVDGVIVLCKKKGDDDSIKGYRPISLLNFDYKILARILKQRMEKIMTENNILHSNQKCSNSKRNIFEAVCAIKDRIAEINCKKKSGRLISFDLDHAFDRVNFDFLFSVMRNMRFNSDFVSLVQKIMSMSHSRVLVNGNLTLEFPIQRSVRQGDPLSMHLFVLYLHPLLEKLTSICNSPLELVVAYADDISIIVMDETKLDTIKEAFMDFGACSGAKLNLTKTTSILVGRQLNMIYDCGWLGTQESVKILGIVYFNSQKRTIDFNWSDVIRKTSQLMWLFKPRVLSVHQKVILVNTFVTSRLWFMASILSIPNSAVARMTSQIGFFIWGRYPCRVAMEQLTLPVEKGGLNLHLPMHKCKALLLNRFLLCQQQTPFASSFLVHMTNPPNVIAIPALYPCLKKIAKELPYIPRNVSRNPSAKALECYYHSSLKMPKIMEEHPSIQWTRVWRNIRHRTLSSEEKSTYYLLVNQKIPHAAMFYRQNRAASEMCSHCQNAVEDLEHKLSVCRRVRHLWDHLRTKLEGILNRSVSFKMLMFPELNSANRNARNKALKMFIVYVNFVLDVNNCFTVEALDFNLCCFCQ